MESTDRKVLILALPLAFLLAFGAKYFLPTEFLFGFAQIWIHEFGHAFMAWLSGRQATPLGLGWTNINPERSLVVFVCFAFLLGVVVYKSWLHDAWFLAGAGVVLFLAQLYFTFGLNRDQFEILVGWGGVGGEFWISALLVVAFYFKMPGRLRWDFFRYIFLLIGAYAFLHTYLLWVKISHHQASVPWGTMWGGDSDAGGDMNRLVDEFGWSNQDLVRSYLRTGNWCLVAIFGTYLALMAKSFLRSAVPAGESAPLAEPEPASNSKLRWYLYIDDQVSGPFDSVQLPGMLASGAIQPETPCCVVGTEEWRTVKDCVREH